MNMKTFVSSLTDYEKEELLKVLSVSNESPFPSLNEIQKFNRGERVAAIIEHRRRTGMGLKDSKNSLEMSVHYYNRTGTVRS